MNSLNKTFIPNQIHDNPNWFIIDCKNQKLGRLSTVISQLLKGKIKPDYFPSIDRGDYIILINTKFILINKETKHYIVNKPGSPGNSLKIKNTSDLLPELIIKRAVKGMLSRTETKRLLKRLRIYKDQSHPHIAQNPIEINLANI